MADLDDAIRYARQQVGDPYVWGAEGPNGFDCSGLLYAAYRAAGFDVKRTTAAEIGKGNGGYGDVLPTNSMGSAKAGDVLYYDNPGPTDHVAIYLGGSSMVEAPQDGVPVRVTAVRRPTKIISPRPESGGWSDVPGMDEAGNAIGGVGDAIGGALGVGLDAINPFDDWAAQGFGLGMKLLAAGAAAALVIVGAREALNQKGS